MVQVASALSSVPAVAYLAVFLTIFSVISYDVNNPFSLHILRNVDLAVHKSVMDGVPLTFRAFTADKIISNVPIGLCALGSLVGLQLVLTKNWRKGLFLGGLLGTFNFLCAFQYHV
jgi:hypothetical protein